jgi:hypothetical protein
MKVKELNNVIDGVARVEQWVGARNLFLRSSQLQ